MKTTAPLRRKQIVKRLTAGAVSVEELARDTGASEITIRRDLAALAREGLLERVRGGAVPNERVAYEFSFKEKESRNREAKEAIGRTAAKLVKRGAAVFLDTGTTSLAVARCLRAARPSVIVTINLCVASEFVGQNAIRILVPGGEVGRLSPDLYGEWTLAMLGKVDVDVAFLGCDAVDPGEGYFCATPQGAAVSRTMLSRSRRAYLLADSSKWGTRSLCRIGELAELSGIVTDNGLAAEHRAFARKIGVDLILPQG